MAFAASNGHDSKKKILHASEQQRPDVVEERRLFARRRLRWPCASLVFVDECGVNLSMTRANGWAPRGERVVDHVPGRRWESFSVVAGIRRDRVVAPMILPGAMNGEAFRVWTRECLAPELRPGDTVVWDNLSIHEDAEARWSIEARGARLRFLPPYSPDLNPIELAWSKAKTLLRAAAPRDWKTLVAAVGHALRAISPSDCNGWFSHCGYAFS